MEILQISFITLISYFAGVISSPVVGDLLQGLITQISYAKKYWKL